MKDNVRMGLGRLDFIFRSFWGAECCFFFLWLWPVQSRLLSTDAKGWRSRAFSGLLYSNVFRSWRRFMSSAYCDKQKVKIFNEHRTSSSRGIPRKQEFERYDDPSCPIDPWNLHYFKDDFLPLNVSNAIQKFRDSPGPRPPGAHAFRMSDLRGRHLVDVIVCGHLSGFCGRSDLNIS